MGSLILDDLTAGATLQGPLLPLLVDDLGAGKTIMAGLLLMKLKVRWIVTRPISYGAYLATVQHGRDGQV